MDLSTKWLVCHPRFDSPEVYEYLENLSPLEQGIAKRFPPGTRILLEDAEVSVVGYTAKGNLLVSSLSLDAATEQEIVDEMRVMDGSVFARYPTRVLSASGISVPGRA